MVILLQSGSCLSAVKFFIFICPFTVVSLSIPPKAKSTSFRWGTKLPVGGASVLASIIILPFTVSISGKLIVSNITGTVWKSRPPVSFSLRKFMEVSLARLFTDKTPTTLVSSGNSKVAIVPAALFSSLSPWIFRS